jgi:hypothetical protein
MGRRITIAGATLAVGMTAAGVGLGLAAGGGPSGGPGTDAVHPTTVSAAAVEVSGPRGRAVTPRAAKLKQIAIRYYETKKPLDLGTGTQYFVFSGKPCPKNAKAISGYSYYAGSTLPPTLVTNAGSAPMSLRNWQFYLSNPNGDEVNEGIKFGVICAKHAD